MARHIALAFALLLSLTHPAWAVDRAAASCTSADVQAAINASTDGDRVIVPAGSCTWTSTVSTNNKAITLVGAGSLSSTQGANGSVTITVNNLSNAATFLGITESTRGTVEVANLTFVQGATRASYSIIFMQHVVGGRPASVHHNTVIYHDCAPAVAIYASYNRGVVWRNLFRNDVPLSTCGWLNATFAINVAPNVDIGAVLWNSASTLGALDAAGDKNFYFETNRVENFTVQAWDGNDGVRLVLRYNTFLDSGGASHGHDSGVVGIRQFELYNNTFTLTDRGADTSNLQTWFQVRGGTGVITDNIMPALYIPAFGGLKSNVTLIQYILRAGYLGCPYLGGTYPWLHQIGWGWDGSLDVHGGAQVLDPIYFWNNRVSPGGASSSGMVAVNFSPNGCGPTAQDVSEFVREGRDFYNQVARPGYVKYQYPHPLASGASSTSASPAAPGNLSVK